MEDATEQAARLIGGLGDRPVAAMAYATAWAAGLTDDEGEPVFPAATGWLRRHQHPDGSWGGEVPNPYDRLVSTLAAVLALRESRQDWAVSALRRGVDYLCRHGQEWRTAVGEPIGFEIVAPYLVERASAAGLLSGDAFADLAVLRADKLSRIPPGALEHQPTALLYSLEVLGNLAEPSRLARFGAENGSMANNPAATGALWTATRDPSALSYLRRAARSAGDGGMPEIYPINVFEPAWSIYLLHRARLVPMSAKRHIDRLVELAAFAGTGLGVSEEFPLADSDDTAMVANVLDASGHDATHLLETLLAFESDDHFVGFAHERGAPVSANARVVEALGQRPERFGAPIAKATSFLLDSRREGSWYDKWHLSPYYATAQVVFGLVHHVPGELADTWRWLLDSQHTNGSWGMVGGLPEETAYAVLALDALEPHSGPLRSTRVTGRTTTCGST